MSQLVEQATAATATVCSPKASEIAFWRHFRPAFCVSATSILPFPRSDDEAGNIGFLRRPPHTPGTAQSVNTTLTTEQFQYLLLNITDSIRSTHQQSAPKEDNPFAVARAEFYISQGLTFKFDGTRENLAPWIKKFKTLRSNALWREATYLTHKGVTYDILTEFTKIKELANQFHANIAMAPVPSNPYPFLAQHAEDTNADDPITADDWWFTIMGSSSQCSSHALAMITLIYYIR